jgi:RNA polymerase sigma factor (sigma-70 family)
MARARTPTGSSLACGATSAAACRETGPEPARRSAAPEEQLIAETLDLPRYEAARWRHMPLEQEDLVADGYVGLARAARRYDPAFGVPFKVFARPYVRGAITDTVRTRVRRGKLEDGTFVDVVGFSDLREQQDDGRHVPYELADPGPGLVDTVANLAKLRVVGTLPDRERVALVRTMVEGHTAADVAEDLGVSPDRVYALVSTGSARLRRRAA